MHFFENYYENVVKYDLLNKFKYTEINSIPKLQKVILTFNWKKIDVKNIIASLIAIELLTSKQGRLIGSKNSNIAITIRKGNPIGCKIILKKFLMYQFLAKLIVNVFPRFKNFIGFSIKKKDTCIKTFSFKLNNLFIFSDLEQHYQYFKSLPHLDITIVTDSKTATELIFLLKAFKFPFLK